MRRTLLFLCAVLAGHGAFASNSQDEQAVRTAYAKLAYAVQAKTVYRSALSNSAINSVELAKQLQANELKFDITDMSSGALADISAKPYSSFVAKPDAQPILQVTNDEETRDENGKRSTSHFAVPRWTPGHEWPGDWDVPVSKAMEMTGNAGKFSRYVAATITVRFQGQSRTYHTLWLFGSETLAIDLVTDSGILTQFATESVFPSVLADTSLHSRPVVNEWLTSTQRFESSCKTGKQDVCCDSATMLCGVAADDLRSTKPAPNTKDAPPKGGQ